MRLLIVALAVAGCVPHPRPTPSPPAFGCNAAPAQQLIGRQATGLLAEEAQRLTGAAAVRWIQPDQVVTMEYRADRLNIHLDAQAKVVRLVCG